MTYSQNIKKYDKSNSRESTKWLFYFIFHPFVHAQFHIYLP